MSQQTVVVPTAGVEGNLTSCKIETSQIMVEKNGVFSFTQAVHYRSYDVCSKEVVNDYVVPEFTLWPFILFFGILFTIMVAAMSSDGY